MLEQGLFLQPVCATVASIRLACGPLHQRRGIRDWLASDTLNIRTNGVYKLVFLEAVVNTIIIIIIIIIIILLVPS